ncbi:MAG: GNAT family N-acetyltransferase [Chloroflexota bacterium]|nr:GNAT family N-acetyltransferase [Chloroflexota bacterium]
MVAIRPVQLPEDRVPLLALDRSFTTDRIYHVERTPHSFALKEVMVESPIRKEFPLEYDLGTDRKWELGLVAEIEDTIVGFAALAHQRWNRRTELWHLYVALRERGRGIGRALVEAAVESARGAGMRCIWLETSNLAYPAIQFYLRSGFELCGLDTALYDRASPVGGETALYFARSV